MRPHSVLVLPEPGPAEMISGRWMSLSMASNCDGSYVVVVVVKDVDGVLMVFVFGVVFFVIVFVACWNCGACCCGRGFGMVWENVGGGARKLVFLLLWLLMLLLLLL